MIARRIVNPGEVRWATALLIICLLAGALGSLIFAIHWLPGPMERVSGSRLDLRGADVTIGWLSGTPHPEPWPAPNSWSRSMSFARWEHDIRYTANGQSVFSMSLVQAGWPLPAIERKQMWWDWDDPALQTVENTASSPGVLVRPLGLLVNALVVGGGPWLILIGLPLGVLIVCRLIVRANRAMHARCLACGYEIGDMATCPECGAPKPGSDEPRAAQQAD